jgi:phosphate:Na+ symporter
MLVGFVNSGIMKLGQTISIIMGANIGTTVTSWLLSLTGINGSTMLLKLLKPESFTPILAVIGVVMTMMAKTDRKKDIGTILIGFAVLMFGMETMSGAVEGLKDNESFTNILTMFSNPIMGILVGTIFTAIIQSSSASVGILQAMSLTCVIPYSTAIPVILGQNIGTTITPIISSISGNTESRRVAIACLLIKMIGVIVVTLAFYAINSFVNFAFMDQQATIFNIAVIHTLFNIISTVILMPFCSSIEKISIKAIKGKKNAQEPDIFDTLDERFLSVPSFAVEKCRDLVCDMAKIAKVSFVMATELFSQYDEDKVARIMRAEKTVDKYEDKTSTYLVKIAANNMSAKDSKAVTELLHCIGDIERISDHAVNIAEAAQEMHDKGISFSQHAKDDLELITNATLEVLDMAISALIAEDLTIAKRVEPLEQVIDRLKRKIKNGHISRLREGNCTMELGFILSDLLTNYERVADHCSNIAVCIIEIAHGSFETHEYLKSVKNHNDASFDELYAAYKEKYYI